MIVIDCDDAAEWNIHRDKNKCMCVYVFDCIEKVIVSIKGGKGMSKDLSQFRQHPSQGFFLVFGDVTFNVSAKVGTSSVDVQDRLHQT